MPSDPTAADPNAPAPPDLVENAWDAAELAQPAPRERAGRPLPPVDSDFLDLFDELPTQLQALRRRVREFMERDVAPHADEYWERAEFPHRVIPRLAALGLMEGLYEHEASGQSMIDGLISMEMARVDPSIATFYGVQAGLAMGAYEKTLAYAQERTQFGGPVGRFQLIQQMLVRMLGNIISMQTLVLRVSRMQDAGTMRDEHAALAKQWCAARCREVVQQARELMGGNGILLEYGVARLFADAEAIYSYEGSNEINTLIVGRAITGFGAFV